MTATPRFSDIAQALRKAIGNGQHPVGSILPTELELSAQYQTSRHTMRLALQVLQQQGMVSRRKNAGTRVESTAPSAGFSQALATMEDLVQFGAAHSRQQQKIDLITATPLLAKLLGCEPGTSWMRITSLRLQSGPLTPAHEAMGWTAVYVAPNYVGLEERIKQSPQILICTLLETHYGQQIQEISQEICAVPMPRRIALSLGVEHDAPALRIVRHYIGKKGQALEISVTHHPAEKFSIQTRLKRTVF